MNASTHLILTILFSSGVAIAMKVANSRNLSLGQVLAVNYLVCSISLLISSDWSFQPLTSPLIYILGIFIGVMYVISLWLYNRAITAAGLALSTTLMRLSAAIPTLGSLIIFSEQTNLYQILGLILAFLCLPLSSKESFRFNERVKFAWGGMMWGLSLFMISGITDFAFKLQAEIDPLADPNTFMLTIFGTALILTIPQFFKNSRLSKACVFTGAFLGLTNVLATYFRIKTLIDIPGSIAFPTMGLGVIALTTLVSLIIWKEKLLFSNYAFLFLAALAVVLINF